MKQKINPNFILLQLFLCLLLLSCNKKDEYFIDGSFPGHDGERIMLFQFEGNEIISNVDTAIVQNGKFYFNGPEDKAWLAVITSGNYPDKVFSSGVILEKGKIKVSLDTISHVSGTPLNDLSASNRSNSLNYEQEIELIKENINNAYGRDLFFSIPGNFVDDHFYEIYELLDEQAKSIPDVKDLFEERKKRTEGNKQGEKKKQESINISYIDFQLKDKNGDIKKISDYVGKSDYLFIDFWASWCKPCIADIPHVKEVYEKYKDKGLTVISISIDHHEKAWHKALSRIDAPWPQLMVLEGEDKKIKEAYHFQTIPHTLLLDKNGIILEEGHKSASLDVYMEKILE